MTRAEAELLRQIAAETERIARLPEPIRRRQGLYLDTPRVSGAWIGESPAERQVRFRALRRLADAGLIEQIAPWGVRQTHVRLTEAGRSAVASITSPDTSPDASPDASDTKPDAEAVQPAATHPDASQTP